MCPHDRKLQADNRADLDRGMRRGAHTHKRIRIFKARQKERKTKRAKIKLLTEEKDKTAMAKDNPSFQSPAAEHPTQKRPHGV